MCQFKCNDKRDYERRARSAINGGIYTGYGVNYIFFNKYMSRNGINRKWTIILLSISCVGADIFLSGILKKK